MRIDTLQAGPLGTNCYIVSRGADCAVIDPGGARIAAALEGMGLQPAAILLTHGHYDHTGGVAELRERWPGLPVYLNRLDQPSGDDPYLRDLFPPVPETLDLREGDLLRFGTLEFRVLHTPGHSEGSVVFRCEDHLFCGDTLFAGSCGRTDFPGGSMEKLLSSLKRLAELEGDLAVCPGHMEPSALERERRWNPYIREALRR